MKTFNVNTLHPVACFAIELIIGKEGGYSDDKTDQGGKTNFGISDARDGQCDGLIDINNDGQGDIVVKNLTYAQAAQIYYNDYWLKNCCEQLHPALALTVFDCAVNQGGSFARKALQRLAKTTIDGIIGPKTIATVNAIAVLTLLEKFNEARLKRYRRIVKRNKSQQKYIKGWLNRLRDIDERCVAIATFGFTDEQP
ncbi:MAG: peptidoglycan-binding protein [Gammaproteobacteria bacterium]|nr:MAG: peptidoglycan-binding protein [Gammaproteobacteria bacterium]